MHNLFKFFFECFVWRGDVLIGGASDSFLPGDKCDISIIFLT